MAQHTVCDGAVKWVDVINPTAEELKTLASDFGLHPTSVRDCLHPEHLPKAERVGDYAFLIVRAFDEAASPQATSVRALTRKIAFFCGSNWVLTVQRVEQPFLRALKERAKKGDFAKLAARDLCVMLVNEAMLSYETPLAQFADRMEKLEGRVFRGRGRAQLLSDAYYLRRRCGAYRRLLHYSVDMIKRLPAALQLQQGDTPYLQDLRENTERLFFLADQSYESLNQLVNLHVALESHRTNEVMRLLTVFSLLFLPLNLIAGIYGMNFQHMPELSWAHGYPFTLGLMFSVALGVLAWFRRKGWLS